MRGKDSIKFDGISFRKSSIAAHESEAKFLEEYNGEGYAHIYAGPDREKKLKELYAKATAKPVVAEPTGIESGAVTNADVTPKSGSFKPVVGKGK